LAKKKVKKTKKKGQQSKKQSFDLKAFWSERKDVLKFLFSFLGLVLLLFTLSSTDFFNLLREPLSKVYTLMEWHL